jgi:Fur family transcriptional regulator, peroxide stress response regulator
MKNIRQILAENGLKVTPQRVAVYEAITKMNNHPNAEVIIEVIKKKYPNIAIGTVYNTLETFAQKGIINRIKTNGDVMRYDALMHRHHHLYSTDSRRIEDYYDEELNQYLQEFIQKRNIPNFSIEDINVQIVGRFTD